MAEQDIDIFGEYALTTEEKEFIFGGTQAEKDNLEAEESLYKQREAVSGQDYSSSEDIDLLSQMQQNQSDQFTLRKMRNFSRQKRDG